MAAMLFNFFSAVCLFSLGLYHLLHSIRSHLTPSATYSAKPFYPFPFVHSRSSRLRYLPLYLILIAIFISISHQFFLSFVPDPLVRGGSPVHRLNSLKSAAILLLFFIVSLAILLSESTSFLPLPHETTFVLLSAAFALQFHVSTAISSVQTSELNAKCYLLNARIAAINSILTLGLAFNLKLFVAEIALAGSICLQGLWILQIGLTLYVEAFIPEGCHRLLDVASGVEGSTKCDLEDSRVRAVAMLDLLFAFHVIVAVVIVIVGYAIMVKTAGVRRVGSYEALSSSGGESNFVHMKELTGTQA